MQRRYDNHIFNAREYTAFALDAPFPARHSWSVKSASEILAALKERKVTQKAIGEVIGISQPNAATLYTPAKNGKLRKLSYDEGLALIREFDLNDQGADQPWLPKDATLARFLEAAMPALLAAPGSPNVIEVVAHEIGAAIRTLSRRPGKDDVQETVDTLAAVISDHVGRQTSDKVQRTLRTQQGKDHTP